MNSIQKLKKSSNNNHSKGFTLIEMIVVLLLIVLLMSWGIPNYRDLKARQMATDASNEFLYSLTLARAEAVRHGSNVEVRPRNGGWTKGWRIWVKGLNGQPNVELSKNTAVNPKLEFEGLGADGGKKIVFNSIGGLEGGAEREFTIKNTLYESSKRKVLINMSGGAKVIKL